MRPLTDQDRAILAKHAAGATFRDIAEELGVKQQRVRHVVEHLAPIHAEGQAVLAADPENLDGLRMTGALSQKAYSVLANATYDFDVPDLQRVSDVAAQGRECVARLPKVGPSVLAELDAILARFGIAWNPRPRPFARRTDENRHPLLQSWDDKRERREQEERNAKYWNSIVREVEKIERDIGTGVLKEHPNRDCMEAVGYRLSFLAGYIKSWSEHRRKGAMRGITPEPDDQDDGEHETAGNLICLPGVSLASILHHSGDDPGPSAA